MKIWMLEFDVENYQGLYPKVFWSREKVISFDGRSQIHTWIPDEVVKLNPKKKLPFSNAPNFYTHIPVFDEKALSVLGKYLTDTAEILPLNYKEGNYYAINVMRVIDCIDYEQAKFITFSDGKRIMFFEKYAFHEDKVRNENLFKIIDEPLAHQFVSDDFRQTVLENGLTGFIFKEVWDSEG